MSENLFYGSAASLELNVRVHEDAEGMQRPRSISSPSSSSSSSSSWLKRCNRVYGISSESETSLEYPETPVTEEFKKVVTESGQQQCLEETTLDLSAESHSSDTLSNGLPSVSQIRRRPGCYKRGNREENTKPDAERKTPSEACQSLASPYSSTRSTPNLPLQASLAAGSSYLEKVMQETIETEKLYVRDLKDIIQGYLLPFGKSEEFRMPQEDLRSLFGNIKAIYKFNRKLLEGLKKSGRDPVMMAKCFVNQKDGFGVYADYCTSYPRSLETLSRHSINPRFQVELKHLQDNLKHPLPLQTYLFKPIQRILKYHLLLKNIVTHHNESLPGHDVLIEAYNCMMDVANHLNEMKRNQERRTEIQKLLLGTSGMDLSCFGDLILEDKFNLSGVREVHWAFLFRKGLLIAKKRRDDQLQIKTTIMCSNLMLVESIPKEPNSFHVLPFDSPKTQFTLQARTKEQKQRWCQAIKTLMLDSYNIAIPEKVRQLLMVTGKGHQDSDQLSENSKRFLPRDYFEKRLRRRSIGSISGNNGKNVASSSNIVSSNAMGRSSENLLSVQNEDTRPKGSRSRPLVVDNEAHHQKGERRSQSLDSLCNVVAENDTLPRAVKSEQKRKRLKVDEQNERKLNQFHTKHLQAGRVEQFMYQKEIIKTEEEDKEKLNSSIEHQGEYQNNLTLQRKKRGSSEDNDQTKGTLKCGTEKQSSFKASEEEKNNTDIGSFLLTIKTDYVEEDMEKLAEKELQNSERSKVSRSAALRANSFRKAVQMNRVDSIFLKRAKVQVRRKQSEDPLESDQDQDASSESSNEDIMSKFRSNLLPLIDPSFQATADHELREYFLSSTDLVNVANYSGGLLDDSQVDYNNSRNSSFSHLSTTFESLPASELLTDITHESLDNTEQSLTDDEEIIANQLEEASLNEPDVSLSLHQSAAIFKKDHQNYDQLPVSENLNEVDIICQNSDGEDITVDTRDPAGTACDDIGVMSVNNERFLPLDDSHTKDDNMDQVNQLGNLDVMADVFEPRVLSSAFVKPQCATNVAGIGQHCCKKVVSDKGRRVTQQSPFLGTARVTDPPEAPVRYCSSLPCLSGQVSNDVCNSSAHQSVLQATAECPALVHSRKLSSSDLTGYFLDSSNLSVVEPVKDYSFVSSYKPAGSLKMKGPFESKKSNSSAGNESEIEVSSDLDDGQKSKTLLSPQNLRNSVLDDAKTNSEEAILPASLSCIDKSKNRPQLYFEKVQNPSISSSDATMKDTLEKFKRQSETSIETPSEVAKCHKVTNIKEQFAEAASIRSPSFMDRPLLPIPFRDRAKYVDRQHTYVYRLARAYSSRVKQLQREAAAFKKPSELITKRLLRKWSTVDERTSQLEEQHASLSDRITRNSCQGFPENYHLANVVENDVKSSFSDIADMDSSTAAETGKDLNSSRATSCRSPGLAATRSKSQNRKPAKQLFGLSLDHFPDFCLNRGDGDSGSDDCFDEGYTPLEGNDSNLVKQRVKRFENSK